MRDLVLVLENQQPFFPHHEYSFDRLLWLPKNVEHGFACYKRSPYLPVLIQSYTTRPLGFCNGTFTGYCVLPVEKSLYKM
jgi:hypothetical protein